MNIGELFVNLGIKGADKTIGALNDTRKGMADLGSSSLATKAAIVGAMYALERLFAVSGKQGTELTNFNSLLGVSTKELQQYQYAARQVGVSNEEVDGTFKSLQSTMTKTLMGEGAPKGFARVAQLTGDLTAQDIKKFAEQPQLLIQKLQEYAQKETNTGLKNEVLKSFGVSDNMIAALNRKAFRPEILAKAPTYSEGEINQLDKANIAWSNLGTKIEMAVGKFNAKHGGDLVKDISKLTDEVLKLSESLTVLAEKLKVFELIGKSFKGWDMIFRGITSAVDELDSDKKKGNKTSLATDIAKSSLAYTSNDVAMSSFAKMFMELAEGLDKNANANRENYEADKKTLSPQDLQEKYFSPGSYAAKKQIGVPEVPPVTPKAISPSSPAVLQKGVNSTQKIEINQNLNFQHDGKDAQKTSASVSKAVRDAFRSSPALSQVV